MMIKVISSDITDPLLKTIRTFRIYISVKGSIFYNIDDIDINEDDQILTLSTCSYELANYRIVVVARKIREGEEQGRYRQYKKNKILCRKFL